MKVERVLLLIFCFLFFQNLNAQLNPDEVIKVRYRFYYQNKIYNKKEIAKVLETNDKAFEQYKRSRSINNKANIAGFTSLGLIGFGIGSLAIGDRCGFFGSCPWYGISAISFIASCVAGSAGLAMKRDGNKKRRKSLLMFNNDPEGVNKMGTIPFEFKFGNTQNGVGMTLNF